MNPLAEYEIASPSVHDGVHHGVLAQLHPMGRILDRFGISLDRPILTKGLDLGQLIPATMFKNICLNFQHWPGDIQIRRNMVNSA